MLEHLGTIESIARQAARLGVEQQGRVSVEIKADSTPVTSTDRAMQALIVRSLRALVPDPRELFIVAEEDQSDPNAGVSDPRSASWTAAVDPLDGTTSFISGLPLWGVSIGLLRDMQPVAGVIFMPLMGGPEGWLYRGQTGEQPTRNGFRLEPKPWAGWGDVLQIGVPSNFHRWGKIEGYGGKLRSLGSTAHHLALVAAGALDGAVIGLAHLWDLAAGVVLLESAGLRLARADGSPPDWDALLDDRRGEQPLIAAADPLLHEISRRLTVISPSPRHS